MSSGVQVVHLLQVHLNFLHASAIGFPLLSSAFGLLSSAFIILPAYSCLHRLFQFFAALVLFFSVIFCIMVLFLLPFVPQTTLAIESSYSVLVIRSGG